MIINFEEPCSRCGKTAYLGNSGLDDGTHEQCLAYLCPSCGNESADFVPDIDDILPKNIAWERTDRAIHWFDDAIAHIPFNEQSKMIWCDRCQCFVSEKDLKRWTGDDALHHLCPGCDSDLLPVGKLE